MQSFLISILLLASQPYWATGQTCQFTVFYKGNDIGHIKAVKNDQDTLINYKVTSEVEYNSLLYDYQRTTKASASFSGDEMIACKSKVTKYGDLEEYKITRKEGDHYKCFSHDNASFIIEEEIGYTTSTLYFQEPENVNLVYSESYQELCPIEPLGDGVYKLTLPGDKINHYIYKEGQLQEVKVFRSFINLTFKRK